MTFSTVLSVEDLSVSYDVRGNLRSVIRGVSFQIERGGAYGLVGESGCGKSTIAYSVARYLAPNAVMTSGRILLGGDDIVSASRSELRRMRRDRVSMVYQDPSAALNPTVRVGDQVAEVFELRGSSPREAKREAVTALSEVQIADPESVYRRFPHQLSGGMQQRVVIAAALACNPELLILDEPTTGLDATVEASVLDLVRDLQAKRDTAVLYIAHNLGAVRSVCDRVGVLYAGKITEEGSATQLFDTPNHPYTIGLLRALPRYGVRRSDRPLAAIPGALPPIGADLPACVFADRCALVTDICRSEAPAEIRVSDSHVVRCHHWQEAATYRQTGFAKPPALAVLHEPIEASEPLIQLRNVSKGYRLGGHAVRALVDVNLEIYAGETLGLVGESGSGKSTLAKVVAGIVEPDEGGSLTFEGKHLPGGMAQRSVSLRKAIQVVFQNPDSALNRSWSSRRILQRAVEKLSGLTGKRARERTSELATALQFGSHHLDDKPRQLSGGLKQRLAIARAFAGDPQVVVADEPTSALDVSVQAAILNTLSDLQARNGTAYLLISHDLAVVRYLADRIAVLYLGRIMEIGSSEELFDGPHHPYTEALLSAVPSVDGEPSRRIQLVGEIPAPTVELVGCAFQTRCPRQIPGVCEVVEPELMEVAPGRSMRCHIPFDELVELQRIQ